VIQFDYASAGESASPHDNLEFVVGVDMSTGSIWASTVLSKGTDDPYVISSAASWLSELGHDKVTIQSGGAGELAFMSAVKKKAVDTGAVKTCFVQQAPRHSSQSNGGAERAVSTIRGQIEVFKLQVGKKFGRKMAHTEAFLKWLPRHVAWACNRFHTRADTRLTPYEKVHMLKYARPILTPRKAVVCRRPGALLNKLEMA